MFILLECEPNCWLGWVMRFNVQNLAECLVQLLDTHSTYIHLQIEKYIAEQTFLIFGILIFFRKKIWLIKSHSPPPEKKKVSFFYSEDGMNSIPPLSLPYLLSSSSFQRITDGWCWFFMKKKRREKNFGIFPLYAAAAVFAHLRLLRNIPFLQRVDALHKLLWNFSFTLLMN